MHREPRHLCTLKFALALHDRFTRGKDVLPMVLGDGYLYWNSPVFKNVRDTFLGLGGRYDSRPDFPYFGHKMFGLPEVIENWTVPYQDTVSLLRKLEKDRPEYFKFTRMLRPAVQTLQHETAHCLAHFAFNDRAGGPFGPEDNTDKVEFLKIILGEAFASGTESLASCLTVSARSKVEQLFYDHNSYLPVGPRGFSKLVPQIGLRKLTQLTILAYLYSNFLYEEISPSLRHEIFEFLAIDKDIIAQKSFRKNFDDVLKQAFSFSVGFRLNTSVGFLRSLGYAQSVKRMFGYDPLKVIAKNRELQVGLDKLAQIAEGTFLVKNVKRAA